MIDCKELTKGDLIAYQSQFCTENFIDKNDKMVWRPLRTVYKVKETTDKGIIVVKYNKWLKSKWERTRVFFSYENIKNAVKENHPFLKIENDKETEII